MLPRVNGLYLLKLHSMDFVTTRPLYSLFSDGKLLLRCYYVDKYSVYLETVGKGTERSIVFAPGSYEALEFKDSPNFYIKLGILDEANVYAVGYFKLGELIRVPEGGAMVKFEIKVR